MGTHAEHPDRLVAVVAEDSVSRGESTLLERSVHVTLQRQSLLSPPAIDMIDAQESEFPFPAARAFSTIGGEDQLLELLSVFHVDRPLFVRVLLSPRQLSLNVLCAFPGGQLRPSLLVRLAIFHALPFMAGRVCVDHVCSVFAHPRALVAATTQPAGNVRLVGMARRELLHGHSIAREME